MVATKRRTMGAAIDVSADKLAFIKGGVPSTPMNVCLSCKRLWTYSSQIVPLVHGLKS